MIDIEKNKVNSILIIKLRGIGDVILSTICIKNLLKEFPNAKIDYLTEKPSKEALSNINELNQILVLDRKSNKKKIRTLLDIRKNKYDLIFDFFTNPTTAIMTFLSGAKYRVGFPYRGRKYAYNIYGPSGIYTYSTSANVSPGQLTITFLDNQKQIISGTFYFNVLDHNGDTVKITNGRFDMHYTQ